MEERLQRHTADVSDAKTYESRTNVQEMEI